MSKKTLSDVNVKGQTVLVRTDYNVPLEDGKIVSDFRIRASLLTIQHLLEHGAGKIILMSHLGRPEGKRVKELSLAPVAKRLSELLPEAKVAFVSDVSGPEVEEAVEKLPKKGILLLENLRFYPGEEKNSPDFAREISDSVHADLFVQDGFAVVHRAHASTAAVTEVLPSVMGMLLSREIEGLSEALNASKRPLLLIIGGSKVSDKQPLVDNFLGIADSIAVGGKIAADGYDAKNEKIYVAEDFDEDSTGNKLDIGPLATAKIADLAGKAGTVIWNGLLGKAEDPAYATSSTVIAKLLGEHSEINSIICGGDTTAFVSELQEESPDLHYSLISTGGGAALEFLSGKKLPGIEALEER